MTKRALILAMLWTLSGSACSAVERDAAARDPAEASWFDTLTAAVQADILWKETHESAQLGENGKAGSWDGSGEPWASGTYSYAVVASPTHSGRRAIRSTIDTSDEQSGVRWAMRDLPGDDSTTLPDEAYYSAWVYFPEVFDSEWYMLMQWKTESSYEGYDPVKSVNLEKEDDGRLHLALYDFVGDNGECNGNGTGMKGVSPLVFPTGEWVHVESYYKWDKNSGGSLKVWQNGVEVLRQENTRTQYPYNYGTMPRQWAVNAYGDKFDPNPHTMYLDDAAISKSPLSTALKGSSP